MPLIEVVRDHSEVIASENKVKASREALENADKVIYPFKVPDLSEAKLPLKPAQATAIAIIRKQGVEFPTNVDQLAENVASAADEEAKHRKRTYDQFTFASWILYPLGSLMVIVGKLLEPDDVKDDVGI
jgi:hypothetical protein